MDSASFELIAVGNELLIGRILDTNSHFLAKRITILGGRVSRITVIGDDVDEVASLIRDTVRRSPSFIITVGGLGPTFDDKTLEGIAKALGKPLTLDKEALEMVREKYRRIEASTGRVMELTPPRVKMAKIPEGSKPLHNPVGTAPGVMIKHGETTIISLPGVPSEMEAIFDESIAPLIKSISKTHFYEESLKVERIYESDLAPLIDEAMRENPMIYIKSHPRREEGKAHIELHFTTSAESLEKAKEGISKAIEKISKLILSQGGNLLKTG